MAASCRIEFTSAAARQFRKLPSQAQWRLKERIDRLADNPRPPGVVAIKDSSGALRLRVGDYRVIYRVEDERLVILVVRVGHRREVYER